MTILYSNDCPKCKILKTKLNEKNIQYEICSDIELMISKGFNTMPALEVKGNIMNFLEAINWVKEQ
jgi:glutaredoxin